MIGGEIAVMLPTPRFDGTQQCDGDDRFTSDGPWGEDDLVDMQGMCGACPWLSACRDWSLAHERWNFYAGMTPLQRATVRRKMGVQVVDRSGERDTFGLEARHAVA